MREANERTTSWINRIEDATRDGQCAHGNETITRNPNPNPSPQKLPCAHGPSRAASSMLPYVREANEGTTSWITSEDVPNSTITLTHPQTLTLTSNLSSCTNLPGSSWLFLQAKRRERRAEPSKHQFAARDPEKTVFHL